MKKLFKIKKENKGNITILVMIMGFAVILLTTAMVGYIFHDVKFTEQDKERLRALNIAEAGISNMFANIEKHYYEGTPLPVDDLNADGRYVYEREIEDDGEYQGKYVVTYDTTATKDFIIYDVISKGIDKSNITRTVRVKINVTEPSPALNIYDFVYAKSMAALSGDFRPVDGPFYTEGELHLTAGSGISQKGTRGPVMVERNLYMEGGTSILDVESVHVKGNLQLTQGASIRGAQVNVGGNLKMDGGTYIDAGLVSPLRVNGNISMTNGTRIGESGRDLTLVCGGTYPSQPASPGGTPIYANEFLSGPPYVFPEVDFDVGRIIDEYYNDVKSSALVINGNLNLDDLHPYDGSNGTNSLKFYREGDRCKLEINGNVVVKGNLQIGLENEWWIEAFKGPAACEVDYSGKGIIYATGDIKTVTTLRPENLNDYPEKTLLVLLSDSNITSYVWRDYGNVVQSNVDTYPPFIYVVEIAKNKIQISEGGGKAAIVQGTVIAGNILDANRYNARIWYQEGIADALPEELPDNSSSGRELAITKGEWQEISN
ncbi:MAG: hypothetical protein PHN81_04470 [Actinomycetota bacterium]|nr:hypothetical protein [Actinomycetota bacterium]